MIWKEQKMPGGGLYPGVRGTDEGYLLACASTGADVFAYSLALPGQLLFVIRNVPAEAGVRKVAVARLKAIAESHRTTGSVPQ